MIDSIEHLERIGGGSGYVVCELVEFPDLDDLDLVASHGADGAEVVFYINSEGMLLGHVRRDLEESWFAYVPRNFVA